MNRDRVRKIRRRVGRLPSVTVLTILAILIGAGTTRSQPVIVESDWSLLQSIDFVNPMAAHLNPVDGHIYVGRRGTSTDGLHRIDRFGFAFRISSGSNTAAVAVHPDSGYIFQAEDYGGGIYRTGIGAAGRQTWVSGFHSGDDDPIGMAFAPSDYAGSVLAPGEALVVDRGNSGPDEVWIWSPLTAEGEVLLHTDDGTLVDAVDVAIDAASVFLVDSGLTGTGVVYEVGAGGSLTPFATSEPLTGPAGIAIDPWNGDLLIVDQTDNRVVRVDRTSGLVSEMFTGFVPGLSWAAIDLAPDGRRLVLTANNEDRVYVYGRCDATGQPAVDCNGNGRYDLCDIVLGGAADCNANGLPDSCDLDAGTSDDCNLDGRPDDCPVCPPVEVVFIMDTSTSMNDEAAALCAGMGAIVAQLDAAGLVVLPSLLGICNQPGGAYDCLENDVTALLGATVPGSPPVGLELLGNCPGGNEVCQEDWGLATAVVAGNYGWLPPTASVRLIIPLSDEGSWCGDPVTAFDNAAVDHAIAVARDSLVIVSPITGTGSSSAVINLAKALADSTGGQHFNSNTPAVDVAEAIVALVLEACAAYQDCNENGTLDECDIATGGSDDTNGNDIPDECEWVSAVPEGERPAPAIARLYQNRPNPFNPATVITFELSRPGRVELAIYGVDGRRVATLASGQRPRGPHAVTWRGRDDSGREVPAGVYFYRLQAAGRNETKMMVLMK